MAKKKVAFLSFEEKQNMLEKNHNHLSIRAQCNLLNITRSRLYYRPVGIKKEDIIVMNILDQQHTKTPFYGVPRMTAVLRKKGHTIGKDRVRTLLRNMGLQAIYPGPNLSKRNQQHKIYPYLLNDVNIKHINQVWSTDITYIRLQHGFAYLVAIIDWYSRYVLSWRLSNSLDVSFCLEALEEALLYGKPEIFNTDQGSQFTSQDFTGALIQANINISMDGRGRALDNIFVERLWRSVKYEDIYLKSYEMMDEAMEGLSEYFYFYNNERLHQSLNYKTPFEIHYPDSDKREIGLKEIVL